MTFKPALGVDNLCLSQSILIMGKNTQNNKLQYSTSSSALCSVHSLTINYIITQYSTFFHILVFYSWSLQHCICLQHQKYPPICQHITPLLN